MRAQRFFCTGSAVSSSSSHGSAQACNTNHIHRLVHAQAQCFVHNYVHVCAQAHYSRARHSIHRVFLHRHSVLFIIVFMFVRRHVVLERAILYIECCLHTLSVLFVLILFLPAPLCNVGHNHRPVYAQAHCCVHHHD